MKTGSRAILALILITLVVGLIPISAYALFVDLDDGLQLSYEDRGQGDPILFVHGWCGNNSIWTRYQFPHFAPNYRVLAIDLRGHGNSSKPLEGNNIPQLAKDVRKFIEVMGLEKVTLVGHSMGTMVVLDYYRQFGPDKLKALVLEDMSPCPMSAESWNSGGFADSNWDALHAFAIGLWQNREVTHKAFLRNIWKNPPSEEAVDARYKMVCKTPTWTAVTLLYDFIPRDYRALLPQIKVPTLILVADSGLFPKSSMAGVYMRNQIPNSELVVFKDSGHLLQIEEPEKFNQELERFLHSLPK
jgi:pimeloyl-ACP methyl ester carboxylesterase